jgi:hypothetical protein
VAVKGRIGPEAAAYTMGGLRTFAAGAMFRPDILDAACEEVPLPHPLLYRAKRMFNALAALIHDFRVCGELSVSWIKQ